MHYHVAEEDVVSSRVIGLSDVHGYPHLVNNVIKHSEFEKGKDRLIVVGDWADRGPKSIECFNILDELGAEFIIGNHEAAHLFGTRISPYDYSIDRDKEFMKTQYIKLMNGGYKVAIYANGFVFSHAGISIPLYNRITSRNDMLSSAVSFVDYLNSTLEGVIEWDEEKQEFYMYDPLTGPDYFLYSEGPYWFRPFEQYQHISGLYNGFKQVFGHSYATYYSRTQKDILVKNNHYNIDSCCGMFDSDKEHGVYVIVEDNSIKYVDIKSNIKFVKETI
jgi:hypothetical protein